MLSLIKFIGNNFFWPLQILPPPMIYLSDDFPNTIIIWRQHMKDQDHEMDEAFREYIVHNH